MQNLGAIFDFDGVIIDSHDQHEASWFRLAEELGKPMTKELFKESFGMRNETILPGLFRWTEPGDTELIAELGDRKEEIYREVLEETGIEPLPEVRDLLEQLHQAGVPAGIGSSTSRLNIETVLSVTGMADLFMAISAAEDVTRGKPEPDVFLKAAEKIGREPANCVVFEDAPVGIQAGIAGGMRTVAVGTTHPVDSFPEASFSVENLEGFKLSQIVELF